MSSQIIPVEPFDYVVFGGTGDLAERKLLPALYHRQLDGQLSDPTRIIGASRTAFTDAEYRKFAVDALKEHLKPGEFEDEQVKAFCDRLFYVAVDAKSDAGWDKLKDLLDEGKERVRAFYLAVAPAIFGDISEKIRDHKLITKQTRIVVEKPIGRDLASANELNNTIGKVFREEQIFRIDHYLGKETVQNLIALRFANTLFEPLWNNLTIDHVQITVAETQGVGDRWP
ncbi:MAG: glucose-6-phosphate dehydrogenase, partial [Shinella sp.]|nr:glucose-6-phosphate dehydrogenase [Shinella sp.]